MNTKVVFFMKPGSVKGWLMKTFTGCYSYHCGFLMEDTQMFYDMYWMRRRLPWTKVMDADNHKGSVFKIVDSPVEIPEEYFVDAILNSNTHYGILDYLRFGFRWAYHIFGKTTKNAGGMICSEMVHHDMVLHNWSVTYKEVPSPCDLIRAMADMHCNAKLVFGENVSVDDRAFFSTFKDREAV